MSNLCSPEGLTSTLRLRATGDKTVGREET